MNAAQWAAPFYLVAEEPRAPFRVWTFQRGVLGAVIIQRWAKRGDSVCELSRTYNTGDADHNEALARAFMEGAIFGDVWQRQH